MSKYSRSVLFAFILGQAVQVIAHIISADFTSKTRLCFCAGLGVLLIIAFLAGSHTLKQELMSMTVLPAWPGRRKEGAHEIEAD